MLNYLSSINVTSEAVCSVVCEYYQWWWLEMNLCSVRHTFWLTVCFSFFLFLWLFFRNLGDITSIVKRNRKTKLSLPFEFGIGYGDGSTKRKWIRWIKKETKKIFFWLPKINTHFNSITIRFVSIHVYI